LSVIPALVIWGMWKKIGEPLSRDSRRSFPIRSPYAGLGSGPPRSVGCALVRVTAAPWVRAGGTGRRRARR
jgi:hypothetical protein